LPNGHGSCSACGGVADGLVFWNGHLGALM
jgi:hypothetical protein